jgi:hypothetical protein
VIEESVEYLPVDDEEDWSEEEIAITVAPIVKKVVKRRVAAAGENA